MIEHGQLFCRLYYVKCWFISFNYCFCKINPHQAYFLKKILLNEVDNSFCHVQFLPRDT